MARCCNFTIYLTSHNYLRNDKKVAISASVSSFKDWDSIKNIIFSEITKSFLDIFEILNKLYTLMGTFDPSSYSSMHGTQTFEDITIKQEHSDSACHRQGPTPLLLIMSAKSKRKNLRSQIDCESF